MHNYLYKKFSRWFPEKSPIYDIKKSYDENFSVGPVFSGDIPKRIIPDKRDWKDFLGFPVTSMIGVPAGPLLNSDWVKLAADLGFDIVTYKTIRSKAHPAHPLPNVIYVDELTCKADVLESKTPPQRLESLSITNSFGIPSQERDYLVRDISRSVDLLGPGQVLIVSVVGTPRPSEDFVEDFVKAANIAKEGGAHVIEVNLSCPNVLSCEGSIFNNPELVFEISNRVKKSIGSTPLVVKVGAIEDIAILRKVMHSACRAGAQAICGINTLRKRVIKDDGTPALGEDRLYSGICGSIIRKNTMDFIRQTRKINDEDKLGLTIMATGGATLPNHFETFFQEGAEVAMSATGMMWDPYLALRRIYGKKDFERTT